MRNWLVLLSRVRLIAVQNWSKIMPLLIWYWGLIFRMPRDRHFRMIPNLMIMREVEFCLHWGGYFSSIIKATRKTNNFSWIASKTIGTIASSSKAQSKAAPTNKASISQVPKLTSSTLSNFSPCWWNQATWSISENLRIYMNISTVCNVFKPPVNGKYGEL